MIKTASPLVAIIMGSDSDLVIMSEAASVMEEFNIGYYLSIVSAHRTPDRMIGFAKAASSRGIKVIIAGAGGAAHLPGMVASVTHLPVIGVPIQSKAMNGLDSLYSIVQMPKGVPVATVAINGAYNAGLLALQILAIADGEISKNIIEYKNKLKNSVEEKAKNLEQSGYKEFMKHLEK